MQVEDRLRMILLSVVDHSFEIEVVSQIYVGLAKGRIYF